MLSTVYNFLGLKFKINLLTLYSRVSDLRSLGPLDYNRVDLTTCEISCLQVLIFAIVLQMLCK